MPSTTRRSSSFVLHSLAPMALLAFNCLRTADAQSPAASAICDRACLETTLDGMLSSIRNHDASQLPLAPSYLATENLVPSAPSMMSAWRTVTGIHAQYRAIDPLSQQVFFVASVSEGPATSLLYGRIAVQQHHITELELYVNRSRGESGLMFDPDGPANLPSAWRTSIARDRLPARKTLSDAGSSMFDPAVTPLPAAPACSVVETGRNAQLSPTLQATVTGTGDARPAAPAANEVPISVPCGSVPHRPADALARTQLLDEEQGVVVGIAVVHGVTSAYLMAKPPESNFLPDSYFDRYRSLQQKQRASLAPATPILRSTRTAAVVTQVYRIYDGQVQGFQRFILVMPEGIISPWEHRNDPLPDAAR